MPVGIALREGYIMYTYMMLRGESISTLLSVGDPGFCSLNTTRRHYFVQNSGRIYCFILLAKAGVILQIVEYRNC